MAGQIHPNHRGHHRRSNRRPPQITLPCFLPELPPLDFQRLLPPQISRFLFGEYFLGISFRFHSFGSSQLFHTITSFSRSTRNAERTRFRTSSINPSMSSELDSP